MALGKPITLDEAVAELRDRAARLRAEMELAPDPRSHDAKSSPVSHILALALIEAVNAEWDRVWDRDEQQKVRTRAIELSRHPNNTSLQDNPERILTYGSPGVPPLQATVAARFNPVSDEVTERYVVAVQYCLGDLKPLWAQYLNEAAWQLEEERAHATPGGAQENG
jgi:hypothetical protein